MSRDTERKKKDHISSKLRMDSNVQSLSKYYGENLKKHRELDNVMRKAREFQSHYWNKKILEAEEKDPHRWRHSGYKEMYVSNTSGESSKDNLKSSVRCRSPRYRDSRPRTPRPQSPKGSKSSNNRTVSPKSHSSKNRVSRSPRRRSPQSADLSYSRAKSPVIRSYNSSKSRSPKIRKFSDMRSKIPKSNFPCNQEKETESTSSNSTCSDQSCSVCSPKSFEHRRKKIHSSKSRSRSESNSSTRLRSYEKEIPSTNFKLHFNRQEKYCISPSIHTCTSVTKSHPKPSYLEEYYKAPNKLGLVKQKKCIDSSHDSHVPKPSRSVRNIYSCLHLRIFLFKKKKTDFEKNLEF